MNNNLKYGIELEFFVKDNEGNVVPAYQVTRNLDGNPVVGEIRTKVHDNIVDCVFELEKLLFLEKEKINKAGYNLSLEHVVTLSNEQKRTLREDKSFVSAKEMTVLKEFSIYANGKLGKILGNNVYKASLQINVNNITDFSYPSFEKIQVDNKYKYETKYIQKNYASLFNFAEILFKLDIAFAEDIQKTGRVKGVYAIKAGELGDRIEYRSLPNTVDLMKVIEVLK